MRYIAGIAILMAAGSSAAQTSTAVPLDQLLDRYRSDAPGQPEAEVRVDGWIEPRAAGGHDAVIALYPHGETKLNADPGITVTPQSVAGIRWQVQVPYRHQDQMLGYFEPSAIVRIPFEGEVRQPIVVLVEFAYCVVDFQCFFGEEELTLAALN